MIIEDKELLGDFTIQVNADHMAVYEPDGNGGRKHSIKCANVPEAIKYVFTRRMVSLDKVLTIKEYLEHVNRFELDVRTLFEGAAV